MLKKTQSFCDFCNC